MRVLEHQPNVWFLIEDEDRLILDVHCSHSFFSYSFPMMLNQGEKERYAEDGIDYLDRLAKSINFSAPIAAASKSIYKSRRLDDSHSDKITAAIRDWQERPVE